VVVGVKVKLDVRGGGVVDQHLGQLFRTHLGSQKRHGNTSWKGNPTVAFALQTKRTNGKPRQRNLRRAKNTHNLLT
jgi:hypothetical protein